MHRRRDEQVLFQNIQKFEHGDLPRKEFKIFVVQTRIRKLSSVQGCSRACNNCVDEGDAPSLIEPNNTKKLLCIFQL